MYSLGNKTIVWVVRKVRTDILLAELIYFEVQCLPRSAHLKIFLIFVILMTSFKCVYILNKTFFFFLHQLLLVCLLLCFLLLLLLSVNFLAPDEDNFLSKALVFPCFVVQVNTFPQICSISFVNLTSCCSLIPQKKKKKKNVFFYNS